MTTQPTQNQKGFTYSLTLIGEKFVDFASKCDGVVMDIGAAFGVATIPALQAGAKVIAVDICKEHLDTIPSKIDEDLKRNLLTIHAGFPDMNVPQMTLDGVYISQVFPFLTGQQIEAGIAKIYNWLKPGGKIFIVSFTPYLSHVASYIPVYEEKKKNGEPWPGYIENLTQYCSDSSIGNKLPSSIHHVDQQDVERALINAGFKIELSILLGDEMNELPEGIKFDNRERIGVIARKPI